MCDARFRCGLCTVGLILWLVHSHLGLCAWHRRRGLCDLSHLSAARSDDRNRRRLRSRQAPQHRSQNGPLVGAIPVRTLLPTHARDAQHDAHDREGKKAVEQLDTVLQFNHQKGVLHTPFRPSTNGAIHPSPQRSLPVSNCVFGMAGNASPIALSVIPAQRRSFPALTQVEMLTRIMHETQRSTAAVDLDDWIRRNLEEEDRRQSLVQELISSSCPFDYPHTEVTVRIGHVYSKNVQ